MAYYPLTTQIGARYRLVSPTGVEAVFNNPGHQSYVGMLTEVTGLDSSEVRESAAELVEADGGAHGNFYFGRRPITMNGRIYGHNTARERDLRMDLAKRATLAMRSDASLFWTPADAKTNLVINPSFEVYTSGTTSLLGWSSIATAGMTINASTLTRTSAAGVTSGTYSGIGNATNAADTTSRTLSIRQGGSGALTSIPVTPSTKYFLQATVQHATTAAAPSSGSRIRVYWYDNTGASISNDLGALVGSGTSGQHTASLQVTSPANATRALISLDSTTTGNAQNIIVRWDSVLFIEGTSGTYFDGDTAGYYWQGNPHESVSGDYVEMYVPVRRQQPFRETGGWVKEFQIALVSEYAAIYSAAQKWASAVGGATATAENRGSWPATPVLRLTGTSGSNPVFTNSTNGSAVRTTGGLIVDAGEVLEIDTLNHTAYFPPGATGRNASNGGTGESANRFINYTTTTDWLNLVTGDNSVSVSGTGTLEVLWRDTWI